MKIGKHYEIKLLLVGKGEKMSIISTLSVDIVIHLAGGQGRDYFFNQYFMYTE